MRASSSGKVATALVFVGLFVAAGCSVDAIDGVGGSRGGVGALGDECVCSNGQPDCDANQSGCQQGLECLRGDQSGRGTCTRGCPCPIGFVCRAAGVPGARLACFKTP